MNEAQILQRQLVAERHRFAAVIAACINLQGSARAAHPQFISARLHYLALAASRLEPQQRENCLARLEAARAANKNGASAWDDCLTGLQCALQRRFASLEPLISGNVPPAQLRVAVAIDADSIIAERRGYEQVQANAPPGLRLAPNPPMLP
ncbi:MAG TPA: hypothetical protein VIY54_08725 [Steroidobacteraceae bacterium]